MHQIQFRRRPRWVTLQRSPDPLAGFKREGGRGGKGKGAEGKEWKGRGGREREGKGGKGRGGNVEFHHLLLSNLTTIRYIFTK